MSVGPFSFLSGRLMPEAAQVTCGGFWEEKQLGTVHCFSVTKSTHIPVKKVLKVYVQSVTRRREEMYVFLADSAGNDLHGFIAIQFTHADGVQGKLSGQ